MPDKLTGSEIVKALECCNIFMVKHCVDCPLFERNAISCEKRLGKLALDLINRLQAENERLQTVSKIRLECLGRSRAKAKAEAYKEVFEKLNDKSIRSKAKVKGCGFLYVSVVTLHNINALKKELVGDESG